ncbi:hypothetical protein [Paenibacillus sp. LHD-38]|uniref:hypothetical protein n=1 Tax=Paenibacillus sp. LHD-38 TaxID=3072143 RepID=UPI00280D3C71|nr:hypothetical protein [Paenibacillus sp. LHD-38]MDQ8736604.1 hypothetical protein [Paenibacillus sp. LHD-38]
MKRSSYNPFSDATLHLTVNQTPNYSLEDRTPFNDVIKHGDIISGFQIPKQLGHYPKWFLNPKRILATISLLAIAWVFMGQVIQVIQVITAISIGQ